MPKTCCHDFCCSNNALAFEIFDVLTFRSLHQNPSQKIRSWAFLKIHDPVKRSIIGKTLVRPSASMRRWKRKQRDR